MFRKLISPFASITNPYKVLGLNKGASPNEIKLTYYKLAQQYHPDVNPSKDASKLFQQVNEAYEVLSDEVLNSKRMYDTCGTQQQEDDYEQEFQSQTKSSTKQKKRGKSYYSSNMDYESIFEEFDQFYQQKHGKKKAYRAKKKGDDIKLQLTISFRDSVFGTQQNISYKRIKTCESCHGTRSASAQDLQKCYTCGGSGWLSYVDGGSHVDMKCTNCDGWGRVVRNPCKKCDGQGVKECDVERKIDLPKTVLNGNIIRLTDAGHASNTGGQSGDLLIEVTVQQDQSLRRDGHNIISDMPLTVSEIVLGCRKSVDTIWGPLEINIPGLQQPKTKLQIPQYGIQYGSANWKKGDHVLVLQLKIPSSVSEESRQVYYELYKTQN